jgi:hypothetical protein
MATLTNRPLRLWRVEFDELYARHLCRHSQCGINVVHLLALWGVWYAVYGLLFWLADVPWLLAVPAVLWLGALAPNVSLRVLAASAAFLGSIVAAVCLLPQPPFWVYLILIPVLYKVQSWSHQIYTVAADMTDFDRKYTKGKLLFVVLLLYEVPLALHYLLFAPAVDPTAADHDHTAVSVA